MALLTLRDAAGRLGVSMRQVQHLVTAGELHKVARGLVDETSVDRRIAVRGEAHVRAWSERTAWAAVALLQGADAEWMGASQSSRLKGQLRRLDAAGLVVRARNRAQVGRYRAHPSSRRRLLNEVVGTQGAHSRLGLAESDAVDGYLAATDLEATVQHHGLLRDDTGRVTLRATQMSLATVRDLATRGVVLAALDLAESLDVRERRAGLTALEGELAGFRG